jgi:hypothetical protein
MYRTKENTMALQIDLSAEKSNTGVAAPTAYARIVQLAFDTRTGQVSLAVDVHATQQTRTDGKSPVYGGIYSGIVGTDMPNLDDTIPGVRAVLYTWLKTLPDFAGAIDV